MSFGHNQPFGSIVDPESDRGFGGQFMGQNRATNKAAEDLNCQTLGLKSSQRTCITWQQHSKHATRNR
jgi:hypothetical protein